MNGLNVLFSEELRCVNIGLDVFNDAIISQKTVCAKVEWKPPAGGNVELIKVLDWLEEEE